VPPHPDQYAPETSPSPLLIVSIARASAAAVEFAKLIFPIAVCRRGGRIMIDQI
jgi:hypothetical protein